MQLSLTYYSLGVTISFCKFWFENDTLIQVRYCHLLGIWYVFVVDMLFFSFFLILCMIRYSDVFQFYIHIRFNNMIIRNVSCSFLLHIKMKNIKSNIQPKQASVVNTELSLRVKRVMSVIFSIDLVQYETQHLHFKVFVTNYMHQFGWLSERGGQLFKFASERGGVPTNEGGSLRKGGFQPWRKLWVYSSCKNIPLESKAYDSAPNIQKKEKEESLK